jgi:hypothetical protein
MTVTCRATPCLLYSSSSPRTFLSSPNHYTLPYSKNWPWGNACLNHREHQIECSGQILKGSKISVPLDLARTAGLMKHACMHVVASGYGGSVCGVAVIGAWTWPQISIKCMVLYPLCPVLLHSMVPSSACEVWWVTDSLRQELAGTLHVWGHITNAWNGLGTVSVCGVEHGVLCCKIWGFHGGDYGDWRLLGCYTVYLL